MCDIVQKTYFINCLGVVLIAGILLGFLGVNEGILATETTDLVNDKDVPSHVEKQQVTTDSLKEKKVSEKLH